jgi:hypothetical protein
MRFGVQRQQTLLVTTELVIWRYANAFIFTNQSEFDFGIAYVFCVGFVMVTPLLLLLLSNGDRILTTVHSSACDRSC